MSNIGISARTMCQLWYRQIKVRRPERYIRRSQKITSHRLSAHALVALSGTVWNRLLLFSSICASSTTFVFTYRKLLHRWASRESHRHRDGRDSPWSRSQRYERNLNNFSLSFLFDWRWRCMPAAVDDSAVVMVMIIRREIGTGTQMVFQFCPKSNAYSFHGVVKKSHEKVEIAYECCTLSLCTFQCHN